MTEIGIGAILIVPLFAGILFFSSKVENLSEDIASTRRELLARTARLDIFTALRAEYNDRVKGYLSALYALVPEKDQLINLSKDFHTLAAQSRLTSSFMFVGETPPSDGKLGSVGFRINLRGTLEDFFTFTEKFEKFHYLSLISNFSIARGETASDMLAQGNVYFR